MKILILILMSFYLITGAQASTREGLKAAFDEFNYSLQVEWNQKDQNQYQLIHSRFHEKLQVLYAEGLTRQEMLQFLQQEAGNPQLAKDLESILNVVKINKLSPDEAHAFITTSVRKSQTQGASWSSAGKVILITAGIITTLFISYVLLERAYGATGRWINNWGSHHECRDEYICREECFEGKCERYCNNEVVCI